MPRFARHDHFFVFEDRAMGGRGDKGLSLPYPLFTKEGKRKTLDPDRVGDDREEPLRSPSLFGGGGPGSRAAYPAIPAGPLRG